MSCGCSSNKVPTRCNPNLIAVSVLADVEEGVLVDDNEVAILAGIERKGSGFEFEYNRQLPPEP
jgi:hypothetical protein